MKHETLSKLTLKALKVIATERGVIKYGRKAELINRILATNRQIPLGINSKLKTKHNVIISSNTMNTSSEVMCQNKTINDINHCDDLDIYIVEINNILGEGKLTIRELIHEAGNRGLKKYWKNLKNIDDVFRVFGTNLTRDKGLCGKILEYALFGNMPNSNPNPDLDDNGDIKTNKWGKLKKSGGYRSTERIKIGSAGNTDNWSSFDHILNSSNITELKKYGKMSCGVIPLIERVKNSCSTLEGALNLRILYVAKYDLGKSSYIHALNEDLENIKEKLRNKEASQKGQKYLHLHTQGAGRGKNASRALGYTPKFVTTLVAESIARDKKISIDSVLIVNGRSLYIDPAILN